MIWRSLLALLAVQAFSLFLTLWGSVGIAFGLNPESLQSLDGVVPLVAVLCVAWWMGRRFTSRVGFVVALVNIGFWAMMHLFVAARFQLEFWSDAVTQLGWTHLFWWGLAVLLAFGGAKGGARFSSKSWRWRLFRSLCFSPRRCN